MKRIKDISVQDSDEDLRQEYAFDYQKSKPNRFAGQADNNRVVVVLDPDVSEIFGTPASVNKVLRALIKNMPTSGSKPKRSSKAA
jgi:hypothetical protein